MRPHSPIKRKARTVQLTPECIERLTKLAAEVGSRHPMTMAAEILENISRIPAEKYHVALAEIRALSDNIAKN